MPAFRSSSLMVSNPTQSSCFSFLVISRLNTIERLALKLFDHTFVPNVMCTFPFRMIFSSLQPQLTATLIECLHTIDVPLGLRWAYQSWFRKWPIFGAPTFKNAPKNLLEELAKIRASDAESTDSDGHFLAYFANFFSLRRPIYPNWSVTDADILLASFGIIYIIWVYRRKLRDAERQLTLLSRLFAHVNNSVRSPMVDYYDDTVEDTR